MPTRWRAAGAVAALVVTACTGASEPGEGRSPAPTPTPLERLVVGEFAITEPAWKADGSNWALELSWTAPDGVDIEHYEVRRNGVSIGAEIRDTVYVDETAQPGARYRYEVTGVDPQGRATDAAEASIETGEPALRQARLAGAFVMKMRVLEATGTRKPVRGGGIYYSFDPRCRSGPCDVRWGVRRARTEGILRRRRATYAARLRTPLFVRNCFGDVVDERLDVRLRVTAAAPVGGQWRATRIEGSVGEVSKFRGCVTASIDWSVRGSLQS
jgi:hypothetical protein